MNDPDSYDPLSYSNLADSIASALFRKDPIPLDGLKKFDGPGIYAIYYVGKLSVYALIAGNDALGPCEWPIYTGRAVPSGARKGLSTSSHTSALFNRLQQHSRSIDEASNLSVSDFYCRYLVVEPIWIPLGESLLLSRYAPVWNAIVDGFGNHDPGKGRHKGMRPRWDVLHPGRSWANQLQDRTESADEIERDVVTFLRQQVRDNRRDSHSS